MAFLVIYVDALASNTSRDYGTKARAMANL